MYFIVDIEATCWEKPKVPDLNEIIDIAIIVCDDQYQIQSTYHSLVKPIVNQTLSPFCSKLTGIKQSDLSAAPTLDVVMNEFKSWFTTNHDSDANSITWYTWGDWDLKCLMNNCDRQSISFPFGKHANMRTMYIAKRNYGVNYRCNLREVVTKENIYHLPKQHRALHDARALASIARLIHQITF